MQIITTTAQYNREKRTLFLEEGLPYRSNQYYRIVLKLIPLTYSVLGYRERIKDILDKTYGILMDLPDGVAYVRQIRDEAGRGI